MSSEIRGRVFYRYMSWGEVSAVRSSGMLKGGLGEEFFWTTDYYESAAEAKSRLALRDIPQARLEFRITNEPGLELEGTPVRPAAGEPGGGTEWMSEDVVEVEVIRVDRVE